MRTTLTIGKHKYCVSTDHSASSRGLPVVLRDGEVTKIRATHEADEPDTWAIVQQVALGRAEDGADARRVAILGLAGLAGVLPGPTIVAALAALAAEMCESAPAEVVAEFLRMKWEAVDDRGRVVGGPFHPKV
jgi:hypothetical protein